MASTYGAFKTDKKREKEGVTLDMGEAGKFIVARAGGANESFQKRLMALTKPHRKAIQSGNVDPKLADSLLARAYAEGVLLSWEGVTDEEGKPLEFSVANAMKLFADLPDLFRIIRETAEDLALFRQDVNERDAGN